MTDHPNPTTTSGRRAAISGGRRVDILVALGIVLPAIVALCVSLIGSERNPVAGPQGPEFAPLTSSTVVCPGGVTDAAGDVRSTRTPGVPGGELDVATAPPIAGLSGDATTRDVAPATVEAGSSVVVPSSGGATVFRGRGPSAPGIVVGRDDTLAVPECRAPGYDEWFVGIGASARYNTTLELVNPDDGDAVVDIDLHGSDGPIEEAALHGIQVPANGVRRIDLAQAAPRAISSAAHLSVIRGRVTASVLNTWDPLGRGRVTTDFLPADVEPSTSGLILGLPGTTTSTLFLANPGDDEVRVTTRLVTADSTFVPTDAQEITVAPRSMKAVNLARILAGEKGEGVVGLRVDATGPVASSLRLFSEGDLVLLAPVPELVEPAAAVVPRGKKSLVLGGATGTGVVHVTSYDAQGEVLAENPVEISPDRALEVELPPKAVAITLDPRNTTIRGIVSLPAGGREPGLATLRLRPAELSARVPAIGRQ